MKKTIIITIFISIIAFILYNLIDLENRFLFSLNPLNHRDVLCVERMIDKTGAIVPADTKLKVALAIAENARYYEINPKNLVAIAFVESGFRPTLINDTGDHGLMQINWATWKNKFTRDPKELLRIYKNVEIACKIININRRMGHNDLAAYHSFNSEPQAEYSAKLKKVLRRI